MTKAIVYRLQPIVAFLIAWATVSWFTAPLLAGPLLLCLTVGALWLPFYLILHRMESEWLRSSVPAPALQSVAEEFARKLGVTAPEARMIHSHPDEALRKVPTLYRTRSDALIVAAESW